MDQYNEFARVFAHWSVQPQLCYLINHVPVEMFTLK